MGEQGGADALLAIRRVVEGDAVRGEGAGERVVLVLLMAAAIWALARRRGAVSFAEGAAAVAAIVVAVSLRNWSMDVQFLRATVEAWGLSVLILVGTKSRWADVITLLAGAATIGVALLYLIWV